MQVAVISDIHENYHNLLKALEMMPALGVDRILCLGDLINAGVAQVLARSSYPVFYLLGNNDGDITAIFDVARASAGNLQMSHRSYAFLALGKRRIFATHFPELAEPMARSQMFDAVFYGHDHKKTQQWIGDCLVVNPGEISAHKTGQATFALYDSGQNCVEFVAVRDAISLRTDYVREHAMWQQAHQMRTAQDSWNQ
jgi:putative phosphoesterase